MATPDSGVITIKVPFAVRQRGGRKLVLAPDGAPMPPAAPHMDTTLIKAIARAFRWRNTLELGQHSTIKEIAKAERINPSYVSRILRLTLLSPHMVEATLNGRQPPGLTLAALMAPFPLSWANQRFQDARPQNRR